MPKAPRPSANGRPERPSFTQILRVCAPLLARTVAMCFDKAAILEQFGKCPKHQVNRPKTLLNSGSRPTENLKSRRSPRSRRLFSAITFTSNHTEISQKRFPSLSAAHKLCRRFTAAAARSEWQPLFISIEGQQSCSRVICNAFAMPRMKKCEWQTRMLLGQKRRRIWVDDNGHTAASESPWRFRKAGRCIHDSAPRRFFAACWIGCWKGRYRHGLGALFEGCFNGGA
jgi:hypothetical protein